MPLNLKPQASRTIFKTQDQTNRLSCGHPDNDPLSSHLFSKRSPRRESVELELISLQVEEGLVEDLDLHQEQLVLPGRLPVAHDHGPLAHHGTIGAPEEG